MSLKRKCNFKRPSTLWFKGLKLSSKILREFCKLLLLIKANNKCSIVLKYNILRPTENRKWVRAVKSKPKALTHFKVDPVLKIDETFYKQAESMCLCKEFNGTLKTCVCSSSIEICVCKLTKPCMYSVVMSIEQHLKRMTHWKFQVNTSGFR